MLSAKTHLPEAARVCEAVAAFVVCWTDGDLPLFFPPTQFAPSCRKSKSFRIQRNHKPGLFCDGTLQSKYAPCSDVQLNRTHGTINNLAWSDRTCALYAEERPRIPSRCRFAASLVKHCCLKSHSQRGRTSASRLYPELGSSRCTEVFELWGHRTSRDGASATKRR